MVLAAPALADELILKDGKKIEWVTIRDAGDTYEIETPQGTKVSVKKDDVDRLAKTRLPEVLTGATFTFDKKRKLETVDLMKHVNLKGDSVTGSWRVSAGALTGVSGDLNVFARMPIAFTPPEEFDLTIVMERKEGSGDVVVGLIGGGNQFAMDFYRDTASGISQVGGQPAHANPDSVRGKFWSGKPRTITFMVRKEAFIVQADGKDYFIWKADWSKVSLSGFHAINAKNHLFLGTVAATCTFSKLTLSFPKN